MKKHLNYTSKLSTDPPAEGEETDDEDEDENNEG